MSISSLADDEILRTARRKLDLTPVINRQLNPIIADLQLDNGAATRLRDAMAPVAAASPVQETRTSNALDALVKYIPTETVTLYLAATAALPSGPEVTSFLYNYYLYGAFVVLTPIVFMLVFIGKRRSQKLTPLPAAGESWPLWKLIASTIAFAAWAFAIPPLAGTGIGKVAAAFGALFVSSMLALVGGAIEPAES